MYDWLVPKIAFPLYDRLSKHKFWSGFRKLETLQYYPRERLDERASARLRLLLRHAATHVPYYRELFRKSGLSPSDIRRVSDLHYVPITTKADLRTGFPDAVTAEGAPDRRKLKKRTSGSTGMPLEFYSDADTMDAIRSSWLLLLSWAGIGPWVPRLVLANAAHFYASREQGTALRRGLRKLLIGERFIRVQAWDAGVDGLIEYVRQIERNGSYWIFSFPSYANRLAREMMEQGVELPYYPRAFISTGEVCEAFDRTLLERGFRCRVHNHYGALEIPSLAQSCPDNPKLLHVNTERAIARIVREDGTCAGEGETGRIILTDLDNYVMPFINYDSGDYGVVGPQCSCGRGFPTIERVDGRASETIRTPGRTRMSVSTLGTLIFEVCFAYEHIWEYQAVQRALDEVELRIVPTSKFTSDIGDNLNARMKEILGSEMKVTVRTVNRIEPEPSGKRPIIKWEGPPPDNNRGDGLDRHPG